MVFKEKYHCYDHNDTGVDYFGYQNALGILTYSLRNSVKSTVHFKRGITHSNPCRHNINGIVLKILCKYY